MRVSLYGGAFGLRPRFVAAYAHLCNMWVLCCLRLGAACSGPQRWGNAIHVNAQGLRYMLCALLGILQAGLPRERNSRTPADMVLASLCQTLFSAMIDESWLRETIVLPLFIVYIQGEAYSSYFSPKQARKDKNNGSYTTRGVCQL